VLTISFSQFRTYDVLDRKKTIRTTTFVPIERILEKRISMKVEKIFVKRFTI